MKTTTLREATDGEYTVQYRVDEIGGPVDLIGAQFNGLEIDLSSGSIGERFRVRRLLTSIAEYHADQCEREALEGDEP